MRQLWTRSAGQLAGLPRLRGQHRARVVGVPRKLAVEVLRWTALEEIAVAAGLPLEDVHVAGVRLTAETLALLDGVQLEALKVLSTNGLGFPGANYGVFVDIKVA